MWDFLDNPFIWICVWLGSVLWVYIDARRILGELNGKPGIRSAGQWATLALLFWGIFFFYYLIDRNSIKRRVAEYYEIPAEYR
jgi:hypothetical protein